MTFNILVAALIITIMPSTAFAEDQQNPWFSDQEKLECVFSGQGFDGEWIPLKVAGLGDGMHDHFQSPDAPFVKGAQFTGLESDVVRGLATANVLINPYNADDSGSLSFRVGYDGKNISIHWSRFLPNVEGDQLLKSSELSLKRFKEMHRKISVVTRIAGMELWDGNVAITQARADCTAVELFE